MNFILIRLCMIIVVLNLLANKRFSCASVLRSLKNLFSKRLSEKIFFQKRLSLLVKTFLVRIKDVRNCQRLKNFYFFLLNDFVLCF